MKEALFTANFTEQKSTSDHDVLVAAAKAAGLDADKAREVLTSGAYTAEVRHEEEVWRNRGINAVPSVIFNQRWMIQGGQPPKCSSRPSARSLRARRQRRGLSDNCELGPSWFDGRTLRGCSP